MEREGDEGTVRRGKVMRYTCGSGEEQLELDGRGICLHGALTSCSRVSLATH